MEADEIINRAIYCPHCDKIVDHLLKKRAVTFIEGKCFVIFIKRCNNTDNHKIKENPRKNGFRTDAIPVIDWNAIIKNQYL